MYCRRWRRAQRRSHRRVMAKPQTSDDQRNQKRQRRTAHKGADERPVENLVDGRSRHSDEQGRRQREEEDEAIEGRRRVAPQYLEAPGKIASQDDPEDGSYDIDECVHSISRSATEADSAYT